MAAPVSSTGLLGLVEWVVGVLGMAVTGACGFAYHLVTSDKALKNALDRHTEKLSEHALSIAALQTQQAAMSSTLATQPTKEDLSHVEQRLREDVVHSEQRVSDKIDLVANLLTTRQP